MVSETAWVQGLLSVALPQNGFLLWKDEDHHTKMSPSSKIKHTTPKEKLTIIIKNYWMRLTFIKAEISVICRN